MLVGYSASRSTSTLPLKAGKRPSRIERTSWVMVAIFDASGNGKPRDGGGHSHGRCSNLR